MKTLFQLAFLLLLSGTSYGQNNENNPDPQNGEHGSNPSINDNTSDGPDNTVPYPNGYDYSQPQDPNRYENPNDSLSHLSESSSFTATFRCNSVWTKHHVKYSGLARWFSRLTLMSGEFSHCVADCSNCNGSGNCKWCDGSGSRTCIDCNGSGEEGTVKNADGTTTILKCYRCSGRGSYNCSYCSSSGKCSFCNGTGISPYQATNRLTAIVKTL